MGAISRLRSHEAGTRIRLSALLIGLLGTAVLTMPLEMASAPIVAAIHLVFVPLFTGVVEAAFRLRETADGDATSGDERGDHERGTVALSDESGDAALARLRERYAAGEVSEEEFERKVDGLLESRAALEWDGPDREESNLLAER